MSRTYRYFLTSVLVQVLVQVKHHTGASSTRSTSLLCNVLPVVAFYSRGSTCYTISSLRVTHKIWWVQVPGSTRTRLVHGTWYKQYNVPGVSKGRLQCRTAACLRVVNLLGDVTRIMYRTWYWYTMKQHVDSAWEYNGVTRDAKPMIWVCGAKSFLFLENYTQYSHKKYTSMRCTTYT